MTCYPSPLSAVRCAGLACACVFALAGCDRVPKPKAQEPPPAPTVHPVSESPPRVLAALAARWRA
jgi:hypothetical protein